MAQIINNYCQGSSKPPRDQETLSRQIVSYLKWVQERYGKIELRGIERGGRKVLQLDLDEAYVPLEATLASSSEERDGVLGGLGELRVFERHGHESERSMSPGMSTEPIELDQVLKLDKRLVITGAPGSGKTTVLLHMAWVLATAILGNSRLALERLGLVEPLPLPILIPLATYAGHLRGLQQRSGATPRERTLSSLSLSI